MCEGRWPTVAIAYLAPPLALAFERLASEQANKHYFENLRALDVGALEALGPERLAPRSQGLISGTDVTGTDFRGQRRCAATRVGP